MNTLLFPPSLYLFRLVLAGISPMIWRRLVIPGETSIANSMNIFRWPSIGAASIYIASAFMARTTGLLIWEASALTTIPDLCGCLISGCTRGNPFVTSTTSRPTGGWTSGWKRSCRRRGVLRPFSAVDGSRSGRRIRWATQTACWMEHCKRCPACGQPRHSKGHHALPMRTVFGKITLQSLRLPHCDCQPHQTKTFSPLAEALPERTTPELLFLETKWSSLMS
jgi:hypothetical protein